jgi:hypothetical protein
VQVEVREGFETSFRFRLSSPSQRCMVMDDVYTHCRSRGGDGLAFVMQLESDLALGKSGMGLGYEVCARHRAPASLPAERSGTSSLICLKM